ncbi:MAG: murein biosynthesis integral membrane protein MurJ [Chitinispirillaceae bacterium]
MKEQNRNSTPPSSSNAPTDPKGPKSVSRTISIATLIMMSSVFLSRITGMLREVTLAYVGGTSSEMDAYVAAFLIPELLNHFLAGGFLSVTFIPIFQKYLVKNDHEGAWKTFSNMITIGTVAFLILLPLSVIFAPYILSLTGFESQDPETFKLSVKLTRIILPAQLLFYWGAFLMAVQYANQKFLLPALSPLLYNVGIISGGLLLGPHFGIEGFAWGVLGGAFFGNIVVQLPGAMRTGMKYRYRFKPNDAEFIHYLKITIPLIAGLGMTFSNEIFFRYFASFLEQGAVASANYALRTMMILVGVFGQASGVAFYPYLSKLAAEQAFAKMTSILNNMINKIALYLLPLSAIMMVLSYQIITILYEHGQFSQESTRETAPVLTMYLFGAFASSVSILVARPFYALQKTFLPMAVSTSVSLLSIPLYYLLSRYMGPKGLGLAASLAMTLQFLILYFIWCRRYGGFSAVKKELKALVKIIAVALTGAFICHMIQLYMKNITFTEIRRLHALITCIAASLPSLAVVFVLYEILGLQKFKDSVTGLLRGKKKSS